MRCHVPRPPISLSASGSVEPGRWSSVGEYRPAAVCRRGHVETSDTVLISPSTRCPDCGAQVLTACTNCSKRIRGDYHVEGVVGVGNYTPPDFCDFCGAPHPWATRQARLYELENILDEQNLDPADELSVREQLQALRQPDISEEEQRERWQSIKKLAPGLTEAGTRIIETVVSAAIRSQLGL